MEVKLYFTEACGYCMPIVDYVKEKGLKVELCDATRDKGHKRDILKIGGRMQVPFMTVDGKGMYESRDIFEWIEENEDQLK